jgi:hypothetical protein
MSGHSSPSVSRSTLPQKRRAPTPSTPPPFPKAISSSTPISNKISGSHIYSSEKSNRQDDNRRLAEETKGLFLGAMPPSEFLDDFLPLFQDVPKRLDPKKAFAGVVKERGGKEVVMYAPFVSMVPVSVVCLANIW